MLPVVIFYVTAWQTHGWDDEFHVIKYIEKSETFAEMIQYAIAFDVHPFGLYIIDAFLFKLFHNWSAVRVIGALFVALSLWICWFMTRKKNSIIDDFLYYVLLCLNPSILLWCTGLRWYTWTIPFICFFCIFMQYIKENFSWNGKIKFWSVYFILCVLMYHMSYFTAIVILFSFFFICWERRNYFNSELKIIIPFGLIAVILVSYQTYWLLTVQYTIGRTLTVFRPFISFVMYLGQYLLSGAALVPVSVFGIFSIVGNAVLLFSAFLNFRTIIKDSSTKVYILSAMVNVLMKLAMAARYYVILTPLQAGVMRDSFSLLKNKRLKAVVLIAYIISTAGGIYAVMLHKNTIKASWNTPYAEIINQISSIDESKKIPVATINPVLDWWLNKEDFNVISLLYREDNLESFERPIFVVRTYIGSFSPERYQKINNFIENHNVKQNFKVGYDDYAWFKRKFDSDYPDYYAEIFLIE